MTADNELSPHSESGGRVFWWHHGVTAIVVGVATLVVYAGVLRSPHFIFDSKLHIPLNPAVHISELSVHALEQAVFDGRSKSRPFASLTLALNSYFFGPSASSFRAVNVVLHALNGLALYWLTLLLLPRLQLRWETTTRRLSSRSVQLAASAIAVIWVVHPTQIQSVTYIIQRMNSLATLFGVLCVCLFLCGRGCSVRRWRWLCFLMIPVLWILGVLSKENVVVLPLVLLVCEFIFWRAGERRWLFGAMWWGFPAVVVGAGVLAMLGKNPWEFIQSGYHDQPFNLVQRLLTEPRVMLFYLAQIVSPGQAMFSLEHHFPVSTSLVRPVHTLLAMGMCGGLIVVAVVKAPTHPLLAFGLLWFFLQHSVESTVLPLALCFDHRQYLPSYGIIIALSAVWMRYGPRGAGVGYGAVAVATVFLASMTVQRNRVWASETALWTDCVHKAPRLARPYYNLGVVMRDAGDNDEALRLFDAAVQADPEDVMARINLAVELMGQDQLSQALAILEETVQIDANSASAHVHLANALRDSGDVAAAFDHYARSLALRPKDIQTLFNQGKCFVIAGNTESAIDCFTATLNGEPRYLAAVVQLATEQVVGGHLSMAVALFQLVVTFDADSATAHMNLANALRDSGHYTAAVSEYQVAKRLDPENSQIRFNYGKSLFAAKAFKDAIVELTDATALGADSWLVWHYLGQACQQHGDLRSAVSHYARAAERNSDSALPLFHQGIALYLLNEYERAADAFEAARTRTRDRREAESLEWLANIRTQQGDNSGAEAFYRAAIAENANLADSHNNLALLLVRKDDIKHAIEHFEAALRLRPHDAAIQRNLDIARRKLATRP